MKNVIISILLSVVMVLAGCGRFTNDAAAKTGSFLINGNQSGNDRISTIHREFCKITSVSNGLVLKNIRGDRYKVNIAADDFSIEDTVLLIYGLRERIKGSSYYTADMYGIYPTDEILERAI